MSYVNLEWLGQSLDLIISELAELYTCVCQDNERPRTH